MITARRSPLAIAGVALCAGLLAGCGGVSKADYEKDVRAVGKKVEKDFDKLSSGQPSTKDLENAEGALDKAADDIDAVEAPAEVEDLHEDLVAVLHDAGDLMGEMAPLLEQATKDPANADQEKLAKVSEDFSKIDKRMKDVQKGYKDKGYDIGLTS
jgi:hypothetical protein